MTGKPSADGRRSVSLHVLFCAVAVMLLPAVSFTQSPGDIQSVNEAWRDYKTAMSSGNKTMQLEAAESMVAVGRRVLGDADERTPVFLINYGVALTALLRREEARDVLREALRLGTAIHGRHSLQLVDVYIPLAQTYAEFGSETQLLKYYKKALSLVETEVGRDSELYANIAFEAAVTAYTKAHSTAGLRYLERARDAYAASKGQDSFEVGLAEFQLGKFKFTKGRYKQSVLHLLAALPLFEGEAPMQLEYQMYTHALLVQAYESRHMSDAATEHCIAIGQLNEGLGDHDYEPLFRQSPAYPALLRSVGAEGYVDFEFTVDSNGFVRNPRVTNLATTARAPSRSKTIGRYSDTDRSFEAAALEALKRFRYAPRVVNGESTSVDGVRTRISFTLVD